MKTSELISMLQKSLEEDGDRHVILFAIDNESNSYSPLADYWTGSYVKKTEWSGDAYLDKLTEIDKELGYTQEDVRENGELAIFLSPMELYVRVIFNEKLQI